MPDYDPDMTPQLRLVEAHPVETDGQVGFFIQDPTGLATSSITVSEVVLFILSRFDGRHTLDDVRKVFLRQFGQPISPSTLARLVSGLQDARLLADEEFDRFYGSLVEAYRSAPARVMRSANELELSRNTGEIIQDMLDSSPACEAGAGKIVGLVAPHLDYPRGRSCYAAAYSLLVNRPAPRRVVILGTNHYGRSSSVAATGKDFETPLGTTPTDVDFIERLEEQCGDLRADEFDHEREHSIELQLLICQHLWGADAFEQVPILCPDPCGLTGTAPYDGNGVDLRDFGARLRDLLQDDPDDTVVIAGADLSHIGDQFGDSRPLDEQFIAEVQGRDQMAIDRLADNQPDAFLQQIRQEGNPTRVCSAGCLFTTMFALPDAKVRVLRYHQAVDTSAEVCVTCLAAVFER